MARLLVACLLAGMYPCTASAVTLYADSTNLTKVFGEAKDGDTIVATGTFGSLGLQNRIFATRVTLDATNAHFTDTLTIQNVVGLNVLRGTFGSTTAPMRSGRAVAVKTSRNIKFQSNTFIGGGATTGKDAGRGLTITQSKSIQVSSGNFSNFALGLGVGNSTGVRLGSNRFVGMTSDGINIANSHKVTATANSCSGTAAFSGAHPDCIQLWSVLGQPVQSDISLLRNTATGATQGFTSFNAADGGGLRISMIGNTVTTSYTQGVACYGCVDSIFTDNVLSTLPFSTWRTSMRIVGGYNNIILNNTITPYIRPAFDVVAGSEYDLGLTDGDPSDGSLDQLNLLLLENTAMPDNGLAWLKSDNIEFTVGRFGLENGTVPEASVWVHLIVGFGLVGVATRRNVRRELLPV